MRQALFGLVLACSLLAAAPASADHLRSSAEVSATLGERDREGNRTATVSWSFSCSEEAETFQWEVVVRIKPKDPGRGDKLFQAISTEGRPQGSEEVSVPAGARVYPRARVFCEHQAVDPATGEPTTHQANAQVDGEELYNPPYLKTWRRFSGGWCGSVRMPRFLHAGWGNALIFDVRYNRFSSLVSQRGAGVREVRVRLGGAGFDRTFAPISKWFRRGRIVIPAIRPRRTGKITVTVLLAGEPTNSRIIDVKRLPSGCP